MKKLLLVAVVLFAACTDDLEFPPAISGVVPPTPSNFTVTTPDDVVFTLTWSVSNSANIRFYQLYTVDPFTGRPVFADTSSADSVQLVTPIPAPGIVFGVASVSTDNIESRIAFASAP
jgi:hypothetical protein